MSQMLKNTGRLSMAAGRNMKFTNLFNQQQKMLFQQARCFASFQKAVLKPLPYPINGLEPVIS